MEPIAASRTLPIDGEHRAGDAETASREGSPGGADSSGSRAHDLEEDVPPRPAGPSTHLALIVLGIAAGLTILGAVASGLTAGPSSPVSAPRSTPTAKGSPLQAEAAMRSLSAITSDGLPPPDILDALALPKGTAVTPGSATNPGLGLYDRSLSFVVSASQQHVIDFYRAELSADLWHVVSQGPASHGGGFQVIAQHPASNGYEWEVGVTIMPETFAGSSAGSSSTGSSSAGSSSADGSAAGSSTPSTSQNGSTPFTVRLFEVSDQQ